MRNLLGKNINTRDADRGCEVAEEGNQGRNTHGREQEGIWHIGCEGIRTLDAKGGTGIWRARDRERIVHAQGAACT